MFMGLIVQIVVGLIVHCLYCWTDSTDCLYCWTDSTDCLYCWTDSGLILLDR